MQKLSVLQRHISFNTAASWSPGGIQQTFSANKFFDQEAAAWRSGLLLISTSNSTFAQQAAWKAQLSQDHFSSRKPKFPFPVS